MSILVNKQSKIISQGITGNQGSFHTEQCIDYGTQVVAGVTPGRGGESHLGVPVYNTMREAVAETGADVMRHASLRASVRTDLAGFTRAVCAAADHFRAHSLDQGHTP